MKTTALVATTGLAFLPLIGCGASSTHVPAAAGQQAGYFIECNGIQNSMSTCFAEAAERCPQGYAILDANNGSGGMGGGSALGVVGHSGVNKHLLVRCG